MVIQQSMATFFYHAFVSIHPANLSDFFNTYLTLQHFVCSAGAGVMQI
jgi:hypothetical protein